MTCDDGHFRRIQFVGNFYPGYRKMMMTTLKAFGVAVSLTFILIVMMPSGSVITGGF